MDYRKVNETDRVGCVVDYRMDNMIRRLGFVHSGLDRKDNVTGWVGYTVDYKKDNVSDRRDWVHSGLQKEQRQ